MKKYQLIPVILATLVLWTSGCSIEKFLNKVVVPAPYSVEAESAALHAQLWVADMHSDSLLWNRDLLQHGDYGHVDLPRLLEGGVDFFVASTVSKTPWGLNMDANESDSDMLIANSILQGWPSRTWSSLMERVLYQGEKLRDFAARSQGQLQIIESASELQAVLDSQASEKIVGTMLATEGGHVLEGDIENLQVLYDAGFRSMGIVHFFDNRLGGSAHGMVKGGLTDFGRDVITRMEQLGIFVDLAHASGPLIDDVLDVATKPVIVSHTGVYGTCESPRNLSDEHLQRIAANGGLVGIGFFVPAICTLDYNEAARTLRYAVDLIGLDHVAMGSDFDGATPTPTDISGIAMLTQALRAENFDDAQIKAIMGGNLQRFLLQNLGG